MKKLSFLVFALVLMGQGCTSGGGSADVPEGFVDRPKGPDVISEFDAESEAIFDEIALGYEVYMEAEGLAGPTNFTFQTYLDTVAGESTDAFGGEIKLDENSQDYDRWYILYSNGEDGFPSTADDLYKAYTY